MAAASRCSSDRTSTDDPLVPRVRRYLRLHRAAMRRSQAWRRAVAALERRGLERHPFYRCQESTFAIGDGDVSALIAHFDGSIAAAPDAAAKAAIARERERHLDAAARRYQAWRAAADELGLEAASERAEEAWARVDAIDLDALWASPPDTLGGVIALLKLVRAVGWYGGEPEDYAGPQRALESAILFLEALPAPEPPPQAVAEQRKQKADSS